MLRLRLWARIAHFIMVCFSPSGLGNDFPGPIDHIGVKSRPNIGINQTLVIFTVTSPLRQPAGIVRVSILPVSITENKDPCLSKNIVILKGAANIVIHVILTTLYKLDTEALAAQTLNRALDNVIKPRI